MSVKLSSPLNRFQTLPPMPGGNHHYVDSLMQILNWIETHSRSSRAGLVEWLTQQFQVAARSAENYIHALTVLQTIEIDIRDTVQLSDYGFRLLHAEPLNRHLMIAEDLMRRCVGMPEILAVYNTSAQEIHLYDLIDILQPHFPRWESDNPYKHRALWLLSLGCIQQVRGRSRCYEITAFGREIAQAFPPRIYTVTRFNAGQVASSSTYQTRVRQTIEELHQCCMDGNHPERLQKAVARTFDMLGFNVDYRGAPGETDVLVHAHVGSDSYSAAIDTKARHDGKLVELSAYTLQEHRRKHLANYTVVIAGNFAGGKLIRQATEYGITLLSVSLLEEWLLFHEAMPLNLIEYREIFAVACLVEALPPSLYAKADERRNWSNLLSDLLDLMQETYQHGLIQPLPAEQLFGMLVTRLRSVHYPLEQVKKAIEFLSHPLLGVLVQYQGGVALAADHRTLAQSLRVLANQLEAKGVASKETGST